MLKIKPTIFQLAFFSILTVGSILSAQAADRDLTVSKISLVGSAKLPPCTNRLRVSIKNSGSKKVNGTIKIRLSGSAGYQYSETVNLSGGIGPNATRATTFSNIHFIRPKMTAVVDPDNAIAETNENNNFRDYLVPLNKLEPCVKVSIGNATTVEGKKIVFPLQISPAIPSSADYEVKIGFATKNQQAVGGSSCNGKVDFVHSKGTLTLPSGKTTHSIAIQSCKDIAKEAAEKFVIQLSPVANVIVADGEGVGTISAN